jgi:hypothetical protein
MQDNFNLTGWVRNKKMLTENIEEEMDDMNDDDSEDPIDFQNQKKTFNTQNLNNAFRINALKNMFPGITDADIADILDSQEKQSMEEDGEMNENQADWERFYEEGYLAGYAACQRGVPNRFAGGDEDMPASDYSARRNSEKY